MQKHRLKSGQDYLRQDSLSKERAKKRGKSEEDLRKPKNVDPSPWANTESENEASPRELPVKKMGKIRVKKKQIDYRKLNFGGQQFTSGTPE